jgi:hypothetical protein
MVYDTCKKITSSLVSHFYVFLFDESEFNRPYTWSNDLNEIKTSMNRSNLSSTKHVAFQKPEFFLCLVNLINECNMDLNWCSNNSFLRRGQKVTHKKWKIFWEKRNSNAVQCLVIFTFALFYEESFYG